MAKTAIMDRFEGDGTDPAFDQICEYLEEHVTMDWPDRDHQGSPSEEIAHAFKAYCPEVYQLLKILSLEKDAPKAMRFIDQRIFPLSYEALRETAVLFISQPEAVSYGESDEAEANIEEQLRKIGFRGILVSLPI